MEIIGHECHKKSAMKRSQLWNNEDSGCRHCESGGEG